MVICIDKNDDAYKFFVDEKNNFIMISPNGKESVLLPCADDEYDGVCTYDGSFHFLIQSLSGELIYLKCENEVWKKYSIFQNKDKECKIKNIKLTFSENVICAFYTIDHMGKIMLSKHIFTGYNLYITPEIADLTDSRRDFCICTDEKSQTHLFYRNISGQWREIVYDKNFLKIGQRKCMKSSEIYNLCAVESGERTDKVYVSAKKSYTAIMYCSEDEEKEKIITFGIPKNTEPMIFSNGDAISIFWQDNKCIYRSMSTNGGESFSKPLIFTKNTGLIKLRKCGFGAGKIYSDRSVMNFFEEGIDKAVEGRKKGMVERNKYIDETREKSAKDVAYSLSEIKEEIKKISFGIDAVCAFLERLTEFKKESESMSVIASDIGEKNEENIKLFESMSIDEALPEKSDAIIDFEE